MEGISRDALGGIAKDAVLAKGGFEFGGGADVGGDCNSHANSNGYNELLDHMIVRCIQDTIIKCT